MTNPFPRVFPGEKGDCDQSQEDFNHYQSQEDFDRCDAPFEDTSGQEEEEGFGLDDTSEQRWVFSFFFSIELSGSSIVNNL